MNRAFLASLFAASLAAAIAATPVSAQNSAQSSDEIINFFATAIDLGAKRGICVGTEQECAERQQEAAAPTGLDMLVNFELNSAELTMEAREKLVEFSKALRDNRLKAHNFVVEGHTDALGSERYNEQLSERRARSVATFLIANGIEPLRLQSQGMGMTSPRVSDPYDPVNRRVEMRIKLQ